MNLSLIYPHPMTMTEYVEWSKTEDFEHAIQEVIKHELKDVNKGCNRILLAKICCYEIAAEMQSVLYDYSQTSESWERLQSILRNGELPTPMKIARP